MLEPSVASVFVSAKLRQLEENARRLNNEARLLGNGNDIADLPTDELILYRASLYDEVDIIVKLSAVEGSYNPDFAKLMELFRFKRTEMAGMHASNINNLITHVLFNKFNPILVLQYFQSLYTEIPDNLESYHVKLPIVSFANLDAVGNKTELFYNTYLETFGIWLDRYIPFDAKNFGNYANLLKRYETGLPPEHLPELSVSIFDTMRNKGIPMDCTIAPEIMSRIKSGNSY